MERKTGRYPSTHSRNPLANAFLAKSRERERERGGGGGGEGGYGRVQTERGRGERGRGKETKKEEETKTQTEREGGLVGVKCKGLIFTSCCKTGHETPTKGEREEGRGRGELGRFGRVKLMSISLCKGGYNTPALHVFVSMVHTCPG